MNKTKKQTILSTSAQETYNLGLVLGKKCKQKKIFALFGDLGAGKTMLSKGLAKGLNIKREITSPTFIIYKNYKIKNNKDIKNLIHIDAYRLNTKRDLENIGFFDLIGQKDNIIIIEWADKIKRYLPPKTKIIKIKHLDKDKRKIIIY